MKSKKMLLIFAVILIFVVLFLRKKSQKIPTNTYPLTTQNQGVDNNTIQNGATTDQSTAFINTNLQSLNNIVNGVISEDFAEATLDGIE